MRYPHKPGPRAIDPISGFDVPWEDLVRQWDGEMVYRPFMDNRNPQDFVRGIPEKIGLPYARPEPPEESVALPLLWEDGATAISMEGTGALLDEGVVAIL